MNNRKKHVIKTAHQLFVEKGFQATSIQDILDSSGISKGTFYNYFSSKNELLITLIKTIHEKAEQDRNELLIGQDPSDIHVFIKQIELHLRANRRNKLLSLFEEVIVSNDQELNQFLQQLRLNNIRWAFQRLQDIFGKESTPVLLDCAIMFIGILHQNLKYNALANGQNTNIYHIVEYSVGRLVHMVKEVSGSGVQLLPPGLLDTWLPGWNEAHQDFQDDLTQAITAIKKALNQKENHAKHIELLDFVLDEFMESKNPRQFLIESALTALKKDQTFLCKKELIRLEQLITSYFSHKSETD
jgi:AcrR family transcriptional regulator